MNLLEFKEYLDLGSNEGLRYKDESKSRFVSFKHCIDKLRLIENPSILELGTSRSFVDGKFDGCNSNNIKFWNKSDFSKWDWGAGCFTSVFGIELPHAKIITVDLIDSHINRCRHMTDSLGLKNIQHVVSNSLDFLKDTKEKFDLIYLDTGDMWPIESTIDLQLKEAKIIVERNLLNSNGLILIDDVLNGTPRDMGDLKNKYGKSELSLPYFKNKNYSIIYEGYQYILTQSANGSL